MMFMANPLLLHYAKMSARGRGRGGCGMTPQGVTTTLVLTPAVQSTPNNPEHNSFAAPHISESVQASEPLTPDCSTNDGDLLGDDEDAMEC